MSKKLKFAFLFVFISTLQFAAFAQTNKFEGFNIFLDAPETQRSFACAIRYVPPATEITISDLNPQTPTNIKPCSGTNSRVSQSGSTARVTADPETYKWCFQGEDKLYRLSFQGDQYAGRITYNWISTPETPGVYNVKDFGAVGNGTTDDTVAIKSALAFVATRNGGVVNFPEGDYLVGTNPDYKPIVLPSGVIIQGVSGLSSGAPTNNVVQKSPTRIRLAGKNRALLRIGECTERVSIRDIELIADNNENTYGIEGVGAYNSSQEFHFERITFNNFFRGIYVHGLPQTNLGWQFDYIKIDHCRFLFNRDAGIYTNIRNSDWRVQSSLFINPKRQQGQNADSMHFERVGAIFIQDTYGGGFPDALGGTFLRILDSGNTTVINSQTEAMTNSLTYNAENIQGAGDYSYPITFVNNIFGDPIIFKARRTFVSTGNLYGPNTFQADQGLRIYSTGDRFCYDGGIIGCQGAASKGFDNATIVFMTGKPDDGSVKGFPAIIGTDAQFGGVVQMPSFAVSALPVGKANGSMVYCTNCRRNTTPCQAGGTGAPAMVVGNQWSCL